MKLNLFIDLITCARIFSEKLTWGLSTAIKLEQSDVVKLLDIVGMTYAWG